MADDELCRLPATELALRVRAGQVAVTDVIDAHLQRVAAFNPALNALCFVYEDEARQRAIAADDAVARGDDLGSLHGVPYALKDFTPTKGKRTTRGSYLFEHCVPDFDPPLVERLHAAGAILIGKSTTSELAHSSFTRSRLWGTSRNPWDPARTPGGSSGGSAAAVAAGLVPIAEGSDAGGSVRIPASCCGVVGFKPSHGRIPMYATGNDFEQIFHFGPIARTVADVLAMFDVLEGPDDRDPLSVVPGLARPLQADVALRHLRVGLSVDLDYYRVDEDVARNTASVANLLADLGADVEEVHLGWDRSINDAWATHWAVALATLYGEPARGRAEVMDPELLALIDRGRQVSGIELKQVDLVRTWQWERLRAVFDRCTVLVCPTIAVQVPPAEGLADSDFEASTPAGRFAGLEMTSPFNLVPQCPVISVPSGFSRDGLPTGAQIVGRRYDDLTVLGVAAAVEGARPWPSPSLRVR
jgi:Asp-tRNA(Asn)/Glu-tRNA(Gln) amidotransferase A subunit family amidase